MIMREKLWGEIRNPANVDFAALARATALRLVCFRLPVIHFRPLSQSTSSQLYKMVSECWYNILYHNTSINAYLRPFVNKKKYYEGCPCGYSKKSSHRFYL